MSIDAVPHPFHESPFAALHADIDKGLADRVVGEVKDCNLEENSVLYKEKGGSGVCEDDGRSPDARH